MAGVVGGARGGSRRQQEAAGGSWRQKEAAAGILHANVKGTKALNVISDMPCAKVRLQVGLNSLPANSLASWPAYKPLTGQMGHIEPRKVLCLQRERERETDEQAGRQE